MRSSYGFSKFSVVDSFFKERCRSWKRVKSVRYYSTINLPLPEIRSENRPICTEKSHVPKLFHLECFLQVCSCEVRVLTWRGSCWIGEYCACQYAVKEAVGKEQWNSSLELLHIDHMRPKRGILKSCWDQRSAILSYVALWYLNHSM